MLQRIEGFNIVGEFFGIEFEGRNILIPIIKLEAPLCDSCY